MSYTTLYKVPESGPVEEFAEYRNAFRGGFLVWDNLSHLHLNTPATHFMLKGDRAMQAVWNLWQNLEVPESHRIVMASTFDTVMVKHENLPRLIEAFESYCSDVDDPGHISAMIPHLRALAEDDSCHAVCWQQTSVSADSWMVYEGVDKGSRRYDISRDTGHWFLFDELAKRAS